LHFHHPLRFRSGHLLFGYRRTPICALNSYLAYANSAKQVKSPPGKRFALSGLLTGPNSFGGFQRSPYAISVATSTEPQGIADLTPRQNAFRSAFGEGAGGEVPTFLGRFLGPYDQIALLSLANTEVIVRRQRPEGRTQQFLFATIGYAGRPKASENAGFYVRAELPSCSGKPKSLFLADGVLRRYFYLLEDDSRWPSLYALLGAAETASPADLRLAWRVRTLELDAAGAQARDRAQIERAFNVLANPKLRNCYDAMRRDEDAPALFPYGGFGSIFVEGHLSEDGEAFFANRIIAYKPEMTSRSLSLLLRRCEFFADRVICRDPRRTVEVWLDSNLLPGLDWDLTWNQWKHWLKSRIEVEATLVHAGKYQLRNGEWILRQLYAALPSRLRVRLPDTLPADVVQAKAIHALLGEHAELVRRILVEVDKRPVEHTQVQDWFDQLGASSHLKAHHVTWRPDYEPYYFEQLRKRSRTWFLFRNEYLFLWPNVLIAEVPEQGHATYLFAKPDSMGAFLKRYSSVTREDIRQNRDGSASQLGFIGRIVRGRKKNRWLADVLKYAGEKAEYVEALE
jgi:hypothetical protein